VSLWIVMGGQFGSEEKARFRRRSLDLRTSTSVFIAGGPNSGHSFITDNGSRFFRRALNLGLSALAAA
jgi:adenylosuccinate synthase